MRGGIISNEWTNGNTEHVVWKGIRKKKPNFKKRQKYRFFLIAEKLKCG